MKLKLQFAAVALGLALASAAAHAQGALYVNPIAIHVGISTADNSVFSFLGANTTSRMFYGVNLGGYYDIPMQNKKYEVGVDLHDSILHGNNALLNSFLVGPRVAFRTDKRLHPYIEPEIGVGSTRAPNTGIKINKVEYGIYGGADFNLNRHVNWRVAEIGYSSLQTASAGTIGVTASIPSAQLITITTGFTFRLP